MRVTEPSGADAALRECGFCAVGCALDAHTCWMCGLPLDDTVWVDSGMPPVPTVCVNLWVPRRGGDIERFYLNTDGGQELGYQSERTGELVPITDPELFMRHWDAHHTYPIVRHDVDFDPSRVIVHGPDEQDWGYGEPRTGRLYPTSACPSTDHLHAAASCHQEWGRHTLTRHQFVTKAARAARELRERDLATTPAGQRLLEVALSKGGLPSASSWFAGALGEQEVGQVLGHLEPGWTVVHGIEAWRSGADLDHLVLGPTGFFLLNTKRRADAAIVVGDAGTTVSGYPQDDVARRGRRDAKDVRNLLFQATKRPVPPITPVTVFCGYATFRRDAHLPLRRPTDASPVFLAATELVDWLISLPPELSVADRLYFGVLIRAPSLWADNQL
jgi:hypothetical protein